MGRSLLLGVLPVAACGRFAFDPVPAPPEPDQRVLACGAPARFPIGAGLDSLSASATPTGFAVVGVDGAKALRGWTYEWGGDALAPRAQDVSLAEDATTTAGIAVVDGQIVVASIYGGEVPLGTQLLALDEDLEAQVAASSRAGVMAGEGPIARGGGGAAADRARVTVDASGRVDARRLDARGRDLSQPRIVVDSAEDPSSVRIAPGKDGYLLSWTSAVGSPNKKRLARLDHNLDLVAGPASSARSRGCRRPIAT